MKKIFNTHRMPIIISVLIVISLVFILTLRVIAADPAGGGKAAEIESTEQATDATNDKCYDPGTEEVCIDSEECDETDPDDTCSCDSDSPDKCLESNN